MFELIRNWLKNFKYDPSIYIQTIRDRKCQKIIFIKYEIMNTDQNPVLT